MRNKKQQQIIDEIYRRQREDAIRRHGQKFLDYENNIHFFNIPTMKFDDDIGDANIKKHMKKSFEHEQLEVRVREMFAKGEQVPYELKEKLLRLNRPDLFDENGNPTIDINSVGNPSN